MYIEILQAINKYINAMKSTKRSEAKQVIKIKQKPNFSRGHRLVLILKTNEVYPNQI